MSSPLPITLTTTTNPSGADLRCELATAARKAGVTLSAFVRPLTDYSLAWLNRLELAAHPKPETIERVRALVAGRPVPASPPVTLDVAAALPAGSIRKQRPVNAAVHLKPAIDEDAGARMRHVELGMACDALLRLELKFHLKNDTMPPGFDARGFYALCADRGILLPS